MADRRSSRRIAQVASQQSAQHSRGTRANAKKDDSLDTITVSQPSTRSHTRTASLETTKSPLPKSSSNIRTVPGGRNTRTSAAANTRSQPSRTSARSQPARSAAASSSANTRSRRRLPSSDSEDDDSNIDIADDDDVEASQESEEEEEEEEEEESEPAPKRRSRGGGTRQQPTRRAAKAVFSDEDAPGETDDGMDIDDAPPVTSGTVRSKAAPSDDEDAEGEPDDEEMGLIVASNQKAIPVPKIVAPDSDEEDDEDLDEEDEEDEDEDAEGEAVDDEDDEDEDMDDSETPGGMGTTPDISRPDTPDLGKLTRRQRGKYEDFSSSLLELPDDFGSTKKAVPLTAAEQATRRAEMARRRKNQSEQRREEEKMETINKLLKRQATKVNRRNHKQLEDDAEAEEAAEVGTPEPTDPPKMIRWVSNKNGNFVAVPQTWLDCPAGNVYKKQDVAWRRGLKKVGLVEELPDEPMRDV
ncbi:hypothetical protein TWF694_001820 [Orbilia ellipsospora]